MLVWVMEFVALVLLELGVLLIDHSVLLVQLVMNVAIQAKERNPVRLVTILSKEIILHVLLVLRSSTSDTPLSCPAGTFRLSGNSGLKLSSWI